MENDVSFASAVFTVFTVLVLRTTIRVPQYLWHARVTQDIAIASMQPCVRCTGIVAPNVHTQDSKFHVVGVKTCPVRQRPDSPELVHEARDGCHS